MVNWRNLTSEELHKSIRTIVNHCHNKEEVNRVAKEELGYPYNISVMYSEPDAVGQTMSMFMAYDANGKILS